MVHQHLSAHPSRLELVQAQAAAAQPALCQLAAAPRVAGLAAAAGAATRGRLGAACVGCRPLPTGAHRTWW